MVDFDDKQFYKPNSHYCIECVGRRDLHVEGCSVPAKVETLAKATEAKNG